MEARQDKATTAGEYLVAKVVVPLAAPKVVATMAVEVWAMDATVMAVVPKGVEKAEGRVVAMAAVVVVQALQLAR